MHVLSLRSPRNTLAQVPQALASAEVLEGLQKITTEAVLKSIADPYNVCYGDFEPGRLAQRDFSQ